MTKTLNDKRVVELAFAAHAYLTLSRYLDGLPEAAIEEGYRKPPAVGDWMALFYDAREEALAMAKPGRREKIIARMDRLMDDIYMEYFQRRLVLYMMLALFMWLADLLKRNRLQLTEGSSFDMGWSLVVAEIGEQYADIIEAMDRSALKRAARVRNFLETRGYYT